MKTPFFSVIINCYNGERFLREAIDSVYSQTYSNWEIVFWDNASTDKSAEIAGSYDGRLKYHLALKTSPLYAARNMVIRKAKGDYLAFLDVDDLWEPNKLEKIASLISMYPTGAVFGSNCRYIWNGVLSKSLYQSVKDPVIFRTFDTLIKKYDLAMCSIVLNKEVFHQHGGFDERFELTGDKEFILRLSLKTTVYIDTTVLSYIRLHPESETNNNIEKFSRENLLLIEKILNRNQQYLYENLDFLIIMVHKVLFQKIVYLWVVNRSLNSRKLLLALMPSFKFLLFYFVTFIPSSMRKVIQSLYRFFR